MKWPIMILVIAIWLNSSGCAGAPSTTRSFDPGLGFACEKTIDVGELIAAPQFFDGSTQCVSGAFFDTGFYVLSNDFDLEDDGYYDRAVLLDSESEEIEVFFENLPNASKILVIGEVELDEECWKASEAAKKNPDLDVCIPFERPIFFHVSEIVTSD